MRVIFMEEALRSVSWVYFIIPGLSVRVFPELTRMWDN